MEVHAGELVALVGSNGAGKTTTMRIIAGLLDASAGIVTVRGPDNSARAIPPRRRRHMWAGSVQYVFQNPDDQLYLPTVNRELQEASRRLERRDAAERASHIADALGLREHLASAPHDLPRGLRRAVSLGSALASAPAVLLLDEPTVGLDGGLKRLFQGALTEFLSRGGGAIMVSHDADFVAETAHRRVAMNRGKVVASYGPDAWLEGWDLSAMPARVAVARNLRGMT